jgi:hypothetical protein
MSQSEVEPSPQTKRSLLFSSRFNIAMTFMAVIVSLLLCAYPPIWLAPPRVGLAAQLCCICQFSWIPVLFLCLRMRPPGTRSMRRRAFIFLLLSIGLFYFIGVILLGPAIGVSPVLLANNPSCTSTQLSGEKMLYTCRGTVFLSELRCQFEGRDGSPLVRVQSCRTYYMLGD